MGKLTSGLQDLRPGGLSRYLNASATQGQCQSTLDTGNGAIFFGNNFQTTTGFGGVFNGQRYSRSSGRIRKCSPSRIYSPAIFGGPCRVRTCPTMGSQYHEVKINLTFTGASVFQDASKPQLPIMV